MLNFEEIESWLTLLLRAASAHVLSESQRAQIQEYIDVGEYGLALEGVVYVYVEKNEVAPPEVAALIQRLAKAMSMESEPLLRLLAKSQ